MDDWSPSCLSPWQPVPELTAFLLKEENKTRTKDHTTSMCQALIHFPSTPLACLQSTFHITIEVGGSLRGTEMNAALVSPGRVFHPCHHVWRIYLFFPKTKTCVIINFWHIYQFFKKTYVLSSFFRAHTAGSLFYLNLKMPGAYSINGKIQCLWLII